MILKHLDSPGAVRVLSTDFKKAFDKLPHSSVLSSSRSFNIDSHFLRLILGFLSDRWQRVLLRDDVSEWVKIPSGVLQGSVLGPFLFCLVIDSLSPSCSNTKVIKYADDVLFLHFVRQNADDNLQQEWDSILR